MTSIAAVHAVETTGDNVARLDRQPPWASDLASSGWAGLPQTAGVADAVRPWIDAPSLCAFPAGDPCAAVAHELALSEMWSPDQWNAAVALVMQLRAAGMLPPLDLLRSSVADRGAASLAAAGCEPTGAPGE
ncbi:MAG: hypothetical protein H6933_18440 [Burkholderiaceae bacterium]|nr:hypothetical protein [Rhodoferax sp.]MCP5286872.1 hypothetical protein [Burkholderiaceae bacterium]